MSAKGVFMPTLEAEALRRRYVDRLIHTIRTGDPDYIELDAHRFVRDLTAELFAYYEKPALAAAGARHDASKAAMIANARRRRSG